MLSDRRQRVLAALIEEYVARALPVGSRTLTERYQLGVSPATVRNELSVLEDGGYIVQPHTSAGRVPTDAGYRAFVDGLLAEQEAEPQDERCRQAAEELRRSAGELDDLIDRTSSALMRLTDCLSVVLAPSVQRMRIKQLSLVSLTARQAIIVVVTEEGRVANRHIEFAEDVDPESLAEVQRLLGDVFGGRSSEEIERGLSQSMTEAFRNPLVRAVMDEVMLCLQESRIGRAHHSGLSSLMVQPEFSHTDALLPVMQVLEDETVLLHILDGAASCAAGMPSVRIGHENENERLSGVSVVASRYGKGPSAGVVAVIGPTRMDYSRTINAVRMAADTLAEA